MMLSKLAIDALHRLGAETDVVQYKDVIAPNYDADEEKATGIPEPVRHFAQRLERAQAFLIVSPEYNASIPGSLKNVIDWTSRLRPQPLWGHHGLLMSTSPRYNGGNRGCGRCAYRWNTWAPTSSRICSACPTPTAGSPRTVRWPALKMPDGWIGRLTAS